MNVSRIRFSAKARAALLVLIPLLLFTACGNSGTGDHSGSGDGGSSCQPMTCEKLGSSCGQVADGCGGQLACGTCMAPETCGGDGVANVCSATCYAGCPSGYSCTHGVCAGGVPTGLVLDVKTFTVAGSVTLNGGAPEQTCLKIGDSIAKVQLDEATYGYHVEVVATCVSTGVTAPVSFSGQVYPGTYKVAVIGADPNSSTTALPRTSAQVVNPSLAVNANVASLNLDVKTFTVSGSVTLNGGAPEQTCLKLGDSIAKVQLNEIKYGYAVELIATCASTGTNSPVSFNGQVYPGTYKVAVIGSDPNSSTTLLPRTSAQVLNPSLAISANVSALTLDVKTFTVAGAVTLNGGAPEQTCLKLGDSIAKVQLDEATYGYHVEVVAACANTGVTAPVSFSGQVYPGTYKVSVIGADPNSSTTALPRTSAQVVNPSLAVSANVSALALNVKTFTVSGAVTLNGGAPEQTCLKLGDSIAKVQLDETTYGYHVEVVAACVSTGVTAPVSFSGQVYPGTYRVAVIGSDPNSSTTALPRTSAQVVNPSLAVTADVASLNLDVKTFAVAGSVTLNGGAPEQTCLKIGDSIAKVQLSEIKYGYAVELIATCASTGATAPVSFSGQVYPGTYKVAVLGSDPNSSTTALPRTSAQVVNPSLAITANVAALALDVKTLTVSGSVTLNGGAAEQTCLKIGDSIAKVQLSEIKYGYAVELIATCASTGATAPVSFSGQVYPGTYRVSVIGSDPNSSTTLLPRTSAQVVIARLQIP